MYNRIQRILKGVTKLTRIQYILPMNTEENKMFKYKFSYTDNHLRKNVLRFEKSYNDSLCPSIITVYCDFITDNSQINTDVYISLLIIPYFLHFFLWLSEEGFEFILEELLTMRLNYMRKNRKKSLLFTHADVMH